MRDPKSILCQHVSKTLPDSLSHRKELLLALQTLIGEAHDAFASVSEQLDAIDRLELLQKELPLKFSSGSPSKPERDGQ